jgi:SAM-dependent methyltransferase
MILKIGRIINTILAEFGYRITMLDFLSARKICRMAKLNNISVPDFIESEDAKRDARHIGRRDRIVDRILKHCHIGDNGRILEIGPGTGRYMEKILLTYPQADYEIYETAFDWRSYLERTYATRYKLNIKRTDGRTCSPTADNSCDLAHAHAVFVYLPNCVTLSYLDEMARVVKNGGIIAFDALAEPGFDMAVLKKYMDAGMWFPVIFPEAIIMQWAKSKHLILEDRFDEIHGAYNSNYYVFRKDGSAAEQFV